MNKNLIAAVIVSIMCSGAYASEKALETLNITAGEEAIKSISITEPAARADEQAGARGGTWVYTNDSGCVVTAEQRPNGMIIYVQDGSRQQATLGFRNDMKSGDIFAYCSPAKTALNGGNVALSCGEQNNGGYSTRGSALIEMNGGITGVAIEGEVKRALGWKTDTRISCGGLKPAPSRTGTGGCALTLKPGPGTLTVSGANDSCGDYLGMNVFVDGDYLLK
jgi:hypothetical protein